MRPLFLRFRGINSYKEWAEIDFTKFEKYKIFGIFGRTGHGKTTILDAITYALFGTIDRLGKGLTKKAINPLVGFMESSFRFESKGEVFEIWRRTDNSGSNVLLSVVKDGIRHPIAEKQKEVEKKLKTLIGNFDYEHFSKVVILPQGKFAEFLKEQSHKRAESLSKIFGLERYGAPLYELVKMAMRDIAGQIETIKYQLDELRDVNKDVIEEKNRMIKETNSKIKKLELTIRKKREYVEKLERGVKLRKNLLEEENRLKELLKKGPSIKELQRKLTEAEDVKGLIIYKELMSDLETTIKNLEEKLKRDEDQLKLKEKQLRTIEEKFEKFETLEEEKRRAIAERRKALKDAEEKIKELKDKREELERRWKKLTELREELMSILEDEKLREIEKLNNSISKLLVKVEKTGWSPDDEILVLLREEAREELGSYIENKRRLIQLKEEQREKEAEFKELDEKLNKMWQSEFNVPYPGYKEIQPRIYEIEGEIENLIENKQKKLEDTRRKNLYASIASGLKPGEPCPVCGSKEHPAPAIEIEKDEVLKNLEDEVKKLKEKLRRVKSFKKTVDKELQNLVGLIKQKEQVEEEMKRIEDTLELTGRKLEEKFRGTMIVGLDRIEELKEKSEEKEKIKKGLLEEAEKNERELNGLMALLHEWDKTVFSLKLELKGIEDLLEREEKDIEQFIEKLNNLTGGRKLKDVEIELQEGERKLNDDKRKLKETLEKARKEFMDFNTEVKGLKKLIENKRRELLKAKNKLKTEAEKRRLSVDELLNRILPKEEMEKLKERIDNFNKEKIQLEGSIRKLKEQIDNLSLDRIDEDTLRSEKEKLEELERTKDTMQKEVGRLGEELKNIKKNLEKKEKLFKQLEESEKSFNFHSELVNLLEGKNLVRFAVRYYLELIVSEANRYIKELTGGKLSLMFDSRQFNFNVVDHMTGALRPSSTLSGGETFIVSFSLALSLSKHIQTARGRAINFFFIDEGFGTLDNETLNSVAEVLNQLRMQDVLVGFITHVENFKSLVPAYIMVKKDPVRGSTIETVV